MDIVGLAARTRADAVSTAEQRRLGLRVLFAQAPPELRDERAVPAP